MGPTHALSAAVVYLAAAPIYAPLADYTPGQIAVGVGVAAGAGMLPDLDQEGSTIARSLGFVTNTLAWVVGKISGGHRNGTHSLAGVLGFVAVAYGLVAIGGLAQAFVLWLLWGIGMRACGVRVPFSAVASSIVNALVVAAGIAIVYAAGVDVAEPLPLAIAIGCLVHIVGDMLTKEGCPLLWPFSRRRFNLAAFSTGGAVEKWLVAPGLGLLFVGLVCWYAYGEVWDAVGVT